MFRPIIHLFSVDREKRAVRGTKMVNVKTLVKQQNTWGKNCLQRYFFSFYPRIESCGCPAALKTALRCTKYEILCRYCTFGSTRGPLFFLTCFPPLLRMCDQEHSNPIYSYYFLMRNAEFSRNYDAWVYSLFGRRAGFGSGNPWKLVSPRILGRAKGRITFNGFPAEFWR